MYIMPLTTNITPLEPITTAITTEKDEKTDVNSPTFLDVFTGIIDNAVEANAQKSEDMIALMVGDTDNLEQMQANLTKAEIATELLVTVKNSVVDAYNEIVKMSI